MDASAFTLAGNHSRCNQDSVLVVSEAGKVGVVAVFDGHGAFGEVASATARDALADAVAAQTSWNEDPETCMAAVVRTLHDAVVARHHPDALPPQHLHTTGSGTSLLYKLNDERNAFVVEGGDGPAAKRTRSEPIDFGCTAAIAVITGRQLVVGNLGDSTVLLCCATEDDQLSTKRLSVVHAATEAAEQHRIEETCGGTVRFINGYLQATILSCFECTALILHQFYFFIYHDC